MQVGTKSLALIGAIVIAFTLAAYFLLDIEMSAIQTRALFFLLLSEVVLFGAPIGVQLFGSNHSRVFMTAGLTVASSLYFFVTLILTFLTGLFGNSVNTFVLIELGVVALFLITAVSILAFSRGIGQRDAEDISKIGSTEAKRGGF